MVTNVILRSNINISLFFPREGSLNVNYTVEFDNTTEAAAEATAATIDLRTGDETIEVLNETVSASELAVDGKTSKEREYMSTLVDQKVMRLAHSSPQVTSVDPSSNCKQSTDGQFSLSHLHECEVQVDKSVCRVTVLVQVAGRFIPNSDPEGTGF